MSPAWPNLFATMQVLEHFILRRPLRSTAKIGLHLHGKGCLDSSLVNQVVELLHAANLEKLRAGIDHDPQHKRKREKWVKRLEAELQFWTAVQSFVRYLDRFHFETSLSQGFDEPHKKAIKAALNARGGYGGMFDNSIDLFLAVCLPPFFV
jgi:hypothetical protein